MQPSCGYLCDCVTRPAEEELCVQVALFPLQQQGCLDTAIDPSVGWLGLISSEQARA